MNASAAPITAITGMHPESGGKLKPLELYLKRATWYVHGSSGHFVMPETR
jgi:hypothetical protein